MANLYTLEALIAGLISEWLLPLSLGRGVIHGGDRVPEALNHFRCTFDCKLSARVAAKWPNTVRTSREEMSADSFGVHQEMFISQINN